MTGNRLSPALDCDADGRNTSTDLSSYTLDVNILFTKKKKQTKKTRKSRSVRPVWSPEMIIEKKKFKFGSRTSNTVFFFFRRWWWCRPTWRISHSAAPLPSSQNKKRSVRVKVLPLPLAVEGRIVSKSTVFRRRRVSSTTTGPRLTVGTR